MELNALLQEYADVQLDEPNRPLDRRFPYLCDPYLKSFKPSDAMYVAKFEVYNLLIQWDDTWKVFPGRYLTHPEQQEVLSLLDKALTTHQSISAGPFRRKQVCQQFDKVWTYIQSLEV